MLVQLWSVECEGLSGLRRLPRVTHAYLSHSINNVQCSIIQRGKRGTVGLETLSYSLGTLCRANLGTGMKVTEGRWSARINNAVPLSQ